MHGFSPACTITARRDNSLRMGSDSAGAIPRPDHPQLLGSEPHRLARERDVLLGDAQAAEQPLCLRTREALGVREGRRRDLGGDLRLRDGRLTHEPVEKRERRAERDDPPHQCESAPAREARI